LGSAAAAALLTLLALLIIDNHGFSKEINGTSVLIMDSAKRAMGQELSLNNYMTFVSSFLFLGVRSNKLENQ
jgi:hypothetical protein